MTESRDTHINHRTLPPQLLQFLLGTPPEPRELPQYHYSTRLSQLPFFELLRNPLVLLRGRNVAKKKHLSCAPELWDRKEVVHRNLLEEHRNPRERHNHLHRRDVLEMVSKCLCARRRGRYVPSSLLSPAKAAPASPPTTRPPAPAASKPLLLLFFFSPDLIAS